MSATEVRAIPTDYGGVKFRSRAEARWAVFFDRLRVPWRYELEGYQLPSGWYVPDFWLPEQKTWLEVKGEQPPERAVQLLNELVVATAHQAILFWGGMQRWGSDEAFGDWRVWDSEVRWVAGPGEGDPDTPHPRATGDCHYEPCVCACGAVFGFAFEHRRERVGHKCGRVTAERVNPVTEAADFALTYRFY